MRRQFDFERDFSQTFLDLKEGIKYLIKDINNIKCETREDLEEINSWITALEEQDKAFGILTAARLKDGE